MEHGADAAAALRNRVSQSGERSKGELTALLQQQGSTAVAIRVQGRGRGGAQWVLSVIGDGEAVTAVVGGACWVE